MRFVRHCLDCVKEVALKTPEGEKYLIQLSYGEVDSNFLIEFSCSAGHKSLWFYKVEHFDMLYYAALDSYFKGCYSESVMSFSVSLERIYELFIKTVLYDKYKDYTLVENYWKPLSKQSERQFGAFCTLYFSETGEIWNVNEKMVAFRNSVIHKGLITNQIETEDYAVYVTDLLSKLVILIKNKYPESSKKLSEIRNEEKIEKGTKISKEKSITFDTLTITSLLMWDWEKPKPITFDKAKKDFVVFDLFGQKKKIGIGTNQKKL